MRARVPTRQKTFGVAADRPDSPGAEDHDGGSGDDVGSDDEDDGGIETFGDVALS